MEICEPRPRDRTFEVEVTSKSEKKSIWKYLNPNIMSLILEFLDTKTYFTVIPLIDKLFYKVISKHQYHLSHLSMNYFQKIKNTHLLLKMHNLQKLEVHMYYKKENDNSNLFILFQPLFQPFPWVSKLKSLTININYTENLEYFIYSLVSLESLHLKTTFNELFLNRLIDRLFDQSKQNCQENHNLNKKRIQELKVFHLKIHRSKASIPNFRNMKKIIWNNSFLQDFKISGVNLSRSFNKPDCLLETKLQKLDLKNCYTETHENIDYFIDYLKHNIFLEHLHISYEFILYEKAIEILSNKSSLKCLVIYLKNFHPNKERISMNYQMSNQVKETKIDYGSKEEKALRALIIGLKNTNIEKLSLKKFYTLNIATEIKDLLTFSQKLKKLEIYLDSIMDGTKDDLVRTIFEVAPYTNLEYFNKINLKKLLQNELEHVSYKNPKKWDCFFEDVLTQSIFNSKSFKTILFKDNDALVLSGNLMQKHSFHNKFYLKNFRDKILLSQLSKCPSQMQELNLVMSHNLDPFYLECIKKFTNLTKLSIDNRKKLNITYNDINCFTQLIQNLSNLQELHILNKCHYYLNFSFEYFDKDIFPSLKKLSLVSFNFQDTRWEDKIFTCLSQLSFLDLSDTVVTGGIFYYLRMAIARNPDLQTLRLKSFKIKPLGFGEDTKNFNLLLECMSDKKKIKEFYYSPISSLEHFFDISGRYLTLVNVLDAEKEFIEENQKYLVNLENLIRNNPRIKRLFIAIKIHYSEIYQFNEKILAFFREQQFLEKKFEGVEKNVNRFNMYRLRHNDLDLERNRLYYPFNEENFPNYAKKYQSSEVVLITFIKKKKDLFMKQQIADLCADKQFYIISKTSNTLKKLNGIYKINTGIRLKIKTKLSEFNPEAIVNASTIQSVVLLCSCDNLFMSLKFDANTFNHEKTFNFNHEIIQDLKKCKPDADIQITHHLIRILECFSQNINMIRINNIYNKFFHIIVQEKKIFSHFHHLSLNFCICKNESYANQILENFCNVDFLFKALKFESFTWNFYELSTISETLKIENFSHCDLFFLVTLLKNGYLRNVKTLQFFLTSEKSIDEFLLYCEPATLRFSIFYVFLDLIDLELIKIEFPTNSQMIFNYHKVFDFIELLQGQRVLPTIFKINITRTNNELIFLKVKKIL